MSEVKYRAWDYRKNKFIYFPDESDFWERVFSANVREAEQYSGYKDWYEGDIVSNGISAFSIYWDERYLCWSLFSRNCIMSLSCIRTDEMKWSKIGSIQETPELA